MRIDTKSFLRVLVAAIGLCILSCGLAHAEGRVALVIGNGAYRNVPLLPNPVNDASDVAASLQRIGFSVDVLKDAGFDDLRHALIAFGAKARDADMAIIYFAGHGLEVAGENWIVPVDAALRADTDVENESIGLKSLVLAVAGSRTLGLVILDACRNDPFDARMQHSNRTRSVSRGLAPIEPADNVLVAYAAKGGTTATDGDGRNSPFTQALLSHIETPGLEIDFLLRNVRDDVLAATSGRQQPFFYGSLSKDAVYLTPPPAGAAPAGQAPDTPAADEVAWPYVATASDGALVRRFIRQFPASAHRAAAEARAAALDTAAAAAPVPMAVLAAVAPPAGADVPTADEGTAARRFKADAAPIEAAWDLVKTSADPAILRRFGNAYPSRQRRTVIAALDGGAGTGDVLRQLRSGEMRAVLADYGRFVQHPRYGAVWVPAVTPPGWHPYEPCHWVRSRRFDWYYLDRTPWGAIVHHFGRWAHDDKTGWMWVPGVDFSPGWVAWRTTPDKVGWAPMPPVEDIHTAADAPLDTADDWTFMDRTAFTRGCAASAVVPSATVKTLLPTTVVVRDLKIVAGIPVFVLPFALGGEAVDVDIAFDPWPPWLASQIMVDWNWVSNQQAALCLPAAAIRAAPPRPSRPPPVKVIFKPPPPPPAIRPPRRVRPRPEVVDVPPPNRFPVDEPDEPIVQDPPPRLGIPFGGGGLPFFPRDPSGRGSSGPSGSSGTGGGSSGGPSGGRGTGGRGR